MSRVASLVAVLCVLGACAPEPDSGTGKAKQPKAEEAEEAEKAEKAEKAETAEDPKAAEAEAENEDAKPSKEPEPIETERIEITAIEAAAAGLPELGFSLETTGTGMSGTRLGPNEYLHLSGPPGGPLILQVVPATIGGDFASLVRDELLQGATLVEQEVELLGARRRAAAWITGESLARTSWCAVIIGPEGAKQGDPALLLEVGVGHRGDEAVCKTALEDPNLAPVIASFALE